MSIVERPIVNLKKERSGDEVLLEVLQIIDEYGPSDVYEGICANIVNEMDSADPLWREGDNRDLVGEFLDVTLGWEGFSGFYHYPVPSPDEHLRPFSYYDSAVLMWEGEYGESRRALLKFAIEFLKKQLKSEKE